jgi:hypothetical protein
MSGTPTAGTFDNGTGVWSLASLLAGGSHQLTVTVNAPNTAVLLAQVTVTSSLNDPDTGNNTDSASVAVGGSYFAIIPCRLFDTRLAAGPYGGPALAPSSERDVDAANGSCGIPATARALVVNVTVVNSGAAGYFTLFRDGIAAPVAATITFGPSQTRSDNAAVPLTNGIFTVLNGSSGTNHAVIDVLGYYQ